MNLTDQDRIEMAADNCEVLRARLAKYEDAEGRALQLSFPAEFLEHVKHARKELCRKETAPFHVRQRLAQKLTDCLAALKTQPSGVVLPERAAIGVQYQGLLIETDDEAFIFNEALGLVARLNSSPVSSGESCDSCEPAGVFATDGSGPFDCPDCGKKAAAQTPVKTAESHAAIGIEGAAQVSSAPSHGEQGREGWQLVPIEPTDEMIEAACKYTSYPHQVIDIYKAAIGKAPKPEAPSKPQTCHCSEPCGEYPNCPAAPSAGSQEQGE